MIVPIVVIVAAAAWILVQVVGGESRVVEVTPTGQAVFDISNAIGDREDLLERVHVRLQGEPPDEHVVVEGSVKSRALLDELTSKIDQAKGQTRVEVNVTVKP